MLNKTRLMSFNLFVNNFLLPIIFLTTQTGFKTLTRKFWYFDPKRVGYPRLYTAVVVYAAPVINVSWAGRSV